MRTFRANLPVIWRATSVDPLPNVDGLARRTVSCCHWQNPNSTLLTLDKDIPYQQDLKSGRIAILIVRARSNRIQDLLPVIPDCLAALQSIKPGCPHRKPSNSLSIASTPRSSSSGRRSRPCPGHIQSAQRHHEIGHSSYGATLARGSEDAPCPFGKAA